MVDLEAHRRQAYARASHADSDQGRRRGPTSVGTASPSGGSTELGGAPTLKRMIAVDHLTKRYGSQLAVDDISFRCEPGTVTGFLGPNGAGKSTTLRMICGLTPPTAGTATVLDTSYRRLPNPGREVGVLLDASAQHSGRTGREVLAIAARLLDVDPRRADEMLERVGLSRRAARKRVGAYSLGMRQRLGIAHALLADPKVLVLDEPANGLDPEGIHWMRGLLRDFADRAGTVLLSSHLLHEVETIADHLVVISRGRIIAHGAKDELLAASGVVARALDPARLHDALAAAGLTATAGADGALLVEAGAEAVGRAAAAAGVVLLELRPADTGGLEQLFLSLTREEALVS
jgi:ABC-2 type transport system ATP-binding protein